MTPDTFRRSFVDEYRSWCEVSCSLKLVYSIITEAGLQFSEAKRLIKAIASGSAAK